MDNKDLNIVTEVGVFGNLDIDDPTVKKVKRKDGETDIDDVIAEAIAENASTLGNL